MKTYVFACVHNAGRSQMAAAFFNELADPKRARAISAGTDPAERVHPEVQTAMAEVGVDLAGATPQRLTESVTRGAEAVITMGCGERCPVLPGVRVEDWPLQDPHGQSVEAVIAIRNQVRERVELFVKQESVGGQT